MQYAETAQRAAPYLREDTVVVNVAKGLEDGSYKRLSQVLEEELPGRRVVVMSGSSHAEEVGLGRADDDYRCIQRAGGGRRSSGPFDEPSSAAVCQ